MQVDAVRDGRVYFTNPHGKVESVSDDEFMTRHMNVQLPAHVAMKPSLGLADLPSDAYRVLMDQLAKAAATTAAVVAFPGKVAAKVESTSRNIFNKVYDALPDWPF